MTARLADTSPHYLWDDVLNTPGARQLLVDLADYAELPAGTRRIATGCAGGDR